MTDLRIMKVDELKDIARGYSIVGAWKMTKERLIESILNAATLNKEDDKYFDSAVTEEPEATQDEPDEEVIEEEPNGWEKIAKENIKHAYNWIVGENENALQDYEEDSDEYKASYNYLHSGNEIMDDIYREAITTEYGEGYCGGKAPSEMRFAGKKFCKEYIAELLKKDGYMKDNESESEKKSKRKEDLIEYNGKTQNLSAWAKELGMPGQTLYARLRISNWPVEKAFTTPTRRKNEEEA